MIPHCHMKMKWNSSQGCSFLVYDMKFFITHILLSSLMLTYLSLIICFIYALLSHSHSFSLLYFSFSSSSSYSFIPFNIMVENYSKYVSAAIALSPFYCACHSVTAATAATAIILHMSIHLKAESY